MSLLEKAKVALGGSVSHKVPEVTHSKKIALCISSANSEMNDGHRTGFHWSELLVPYETFTGAGWDVDVVSESGAVAEPDEASVGSMATIVEKAKWEDKQYPLHAKLGAIIPAASAKAADYVAIFFAGGHSCCVDFPHARELKRLAAQIYEQGGVVSAVCHGPAIFENLHLSSGTPLLSGKEVTGFAEKGEREMKAMEWLDKFNYKTMEQVAKGEGAKWVEPDSAWGDFTVVSDRVVTGVNPASAKSLAEKVLELLPQDEQSSTGNTSDAATTAKTDISASKTDSTAASATSTTAASKTDVGAAADGDKEQASYSGEKTAAI